jgi:hypothetical protein
MEKSRPLQSLWSLNDLIYENENHFHNHRYHADPPRVVDEEKCKSNFMLLPCGESRTLILPFLISITIWHTEGHAVCLE